MLCGFLNALLIWIVRIINGPRAIIIQEETFLGGMGREVNCYKFFTWNTNTWNSRITVTSVHLYDGDH